MSPPVGSPTPPPPPERGKPRPLRPGLPSSHLRPSRCGSGDASPERVPGTRVWHTVHPGAPRQRLGMRPSPYGSAVTFRTRPAADSNGRGRAGDPRGRTHTPWPRPTAATARVARIVATANGAATRRPRVAREILIAPPLDGSNGDRSAGDPADVSSCGKITRLRTLFDSVLSCGGTQQGSSPLPLLPR